MIKLNVSKDEFTIIRVALAEANSKLKNLAKENKRLGANATAEIWYDYAARMEVLLDRLENGKD